jgi:hypothetical protein
VASSLGRERIGAARRARALAAYLQSEADRLRHGRLSRDDAQDIIARIANARAAFRSVKDDALLDLAATLAAAATAPGDTPETELFDFGSRSAVRGDHLGRWPDQRRILTTKRFDAVAKALAAHRPGRPGKRGPGAFWPAVQALLEDLRLARRGEDPQDLAKRLRHLFPGIGQHSRARRREPR